MDDIVERLRDWIAELRGKGVATLHGEVLEDLVDTIDDAQRAIQDLSARLA
jgi:hypothetical protein